jgi:hypothetical protein
MQNFIRSPVETRPKGRVFQKWLGGSAEPPPTTKIPGLKAWVHMAKNEDVKDREQLPKIEDPISGQLLRL